MVICCLRVVLCLLFASITPYFIFFLRLPYSGYRNVSYYEFETEVSSVQEKLLLSITEASRIFGIGQHRLRKIVDEDFNCKYHLTLGRVIKIKRKPFEQYINDVQQI